MKRLVLCAAVLLIAAPLALAGVSGSKHDLGSGGNTTLKATNTSEVCVFCHTPHQATAAAGQYPLWNHTLSSQASYGVYNSSTLNANDVTDIGNATAGSAAVSNLCMSCHDGTIAVGSLYNPPNAATPDNNNTFLTSASNAYIGTDLSNDHPVNFTYDTNLANADGELYNPSNTTAVANLLISNKVQCSSCHDPHDDTNTPFLVMSNANSALCLTCHIK